MENGAATKRSAQHAIKSATNYTERRSLAGILTRFVLAALVAVIAIAGTSTAAQASAAPEFIYHWSTSSKVLVVQASGNVSDRWALKAVVRDWDAAAVLVVHRGQCADFPNQHCVKVRQYTDTAVGAPVGYAVGQGSPAGADETVMVFLNNAYKNWSNVDPRAVTCHELGHAVGFTHDERSGCTSEEGRQTPSRWELTEAAAAYSNPTPRSGAIRDDRS